MTRFESGSAMVSTHVGIQYIYLNNDLNMNTSDQIKSYPECSIEHNSAVALESHEDVTS